MGTINGPETDDERRHETRYSDLAGYVMQDERCREAIKGISYQWAGKYGIQQTRDDYPELEYIQSENECGNGENTWKYALYVFELMRHYFRNGVSAYIYWNMVLEDGGESSWGWRQNSMIKVKDGKLVYNPEFYIMKHMAHFVKAGAKYVETSGNWSSNTLVFKNPGAETVVITANPYADEKTVKLGDKIYSLPPQSISTITM